MASLGSSRFRIYKKPIASRFLLILALLVFTHSAVAQDRTIHAINEHQGVLRVCASGPDSALARAQRLRGQAAVTAADVLPNPSVVLSHQRTFTNPSEVETIVGLTVPLGIGGRRFILQDAAALRRQQALLDANATLFESALAFRDAYVAASLDQARLAVLTAQQAALDSLGSTMQALAKAGESAGYELLRQQTQARLHQRLLQSMTAKAQASQVLVNAWTGLDVTLEAVKLSNLAGGSRIDQKVATDVETKHPRIGSLEAESRANGLEARAARRQWVPDIEVFAGYRAATIASTTGHGFAISLTVPLTVWDHGQGDAARAEAEQEVARMAADSLKRQHRANLKAARARLDALLPTVAEMDKAATEAASLQGMAQRLYAAGEVTITELFEAFRSAEEAQLARIDVAEEVALARLAVMRSAGTLFDAALDQACSANQRGAR